MRYLITHDRDCGCGKTSPCRADTPDEVSLYLSGRALPRHPVYDGECPYRFWCGSAVMIRAILRLYPAEIVRHCLPLTIPVAALEAHGIACCVEGWENVVCGIGTLSETDVSKEQRP
jgi:hypothetical protein